ncbi:MAG TPA: GGDEF domain-containing protein [Sphingomonas sp.]|nr:GGDEF domain-containing protein [Sphingomonas sp.]
MQHGSRPALAPTDPLRDCGVIRSMLRDAAQSIAQPTSEVARLRARLAQADVRIAELERLADTDPLTGLCNRRPFLRSVARAVRHLERHGTLAAVLFADVDGLKAVNDRHGHAGGDAALMHIARLLQRDVRGSDLVARIGGDEFGLVLDHATEAAARAKCVALVQAVRDTPANFGGVSVDIRLSIGVAAIRVEDTADTLLSRADADMYAAKRAQRSDR